MIGIISLRSFFIVYFLWVCLCIFMQKNYNYSAYENIKISMAINFCSDGLSKRRNGEHLSDSIRYKTCFFLNRILVLVLSLFSHFLIATVFFHFWGYANHISHHKHDPKIEWFVFTCKGMPRNVFLFSREKLWGIQINFS